MVLKVGIDEEQIEIVIERRYLEILVIISKQKKSKRKESHALSMQYHR